MFSGFRAGIGTLAGPTGGYLTGFIIMGISVWICEKLLKRKALAISLITGLLMCYAFGTAWFMLTNKNTGLTAALGMCVYAFIVPDMGKLALSFILFKKIQKNT